MTSKENIKKLIDFLADKELRFGCKLQMFGKKTTVLSAAKKEIHVYSERLGVRFIHPKSPPFKIIGHDIMLGYVLRRMTWKMIEDNDLGPKLLFLWAKCSEDDRSIGTDRSLQSIINASEWEEVSLLSDPPQPTSRLKTPQARELCEFLILTFNIK
jgi:hypothetical protein